MQAPCAGVTEVGQFTDVRLSKEGRPKKPLLKTVEINLVSVIHSQYSCQFSLRVALTLRPATQLAYHYMNKNTDKKSLKSLVLVASMGMSSCSL